MMFNCKIDETVREIVKKELRRQQNTLMMIPSENYLSPDMVRFQGNILTNKYSEGYPDKRYYRGNKYTDDIEKLAVRRVKEAFGAEHANVQPHSGSQANEAAYMALLNHGDTIMSLDLTHGGHLTHGRNVNFSGMCYKIVHYGVSKKTGIFDYREVRQIALDARPRIIVTGASAYPRIFDFAIWRGIADEVGAYLMADISHIAGLVVAGVHPSPFPYADVVTSTTHKTLAGPRGAVIMCKKEYAEKIDRAVFPGLQGGPFMNIIAAKAVLFGQIMTEEFKTYQTQIVKNAKTLAESLVKKGFDLISGGTDNHLMLIDLRRRKITGSKAAIALEKAGIVVNKNTIPFDERSPVVTSGVRIGTPAVTNRGMKETEMEEIASFIGHIIDDPYNENVLENTKKTVKELCKQFPVYKELD